MVKLLTIYENLEYGELFQSYLAKDRTIKPEHYHGINILINNALIDLHTRMDLMADFVYVKYVPTLGEYELKLSHRESINTDPYQGYILDKKHPFNGQIIKIKSIHYHIPCTLDGSVLRKVEVTLNTQNACYPYALTPTYDRIQLYLDKDIPVVPEEFIVNYQSYCELIPSNLGDITEFELDIPIWLIDPIITFLGYKVLSRMSVKTASQDAATYYNKYLATIQQLQKTNMLNRGSYLNLNLDRNGWV